MLSKNADNEVIVAVDHGLHHGVFERFEDPEATLETLLDTGVDGFLAGVPFFRRFEDQLDAHSNMIKIATIDLIHNSTFPGEDEGTEIHQQVFSVEEAARIGADAIEAALVSGREDPDVLEQNTNFIVSASETARQFDLASVVEPTLWGKRADNELHAERLAHANRIGFELGADVLKSPYPGDPDSFEPIVDNAPLPVYIAGGPATETDREALGMVKGAMDVGANSVMIGRNIWQREDPAEIVAQMSAIVHGGATVDEALE